MRDREATARTHAKPMRQNLTKAEAVIWSKIKGKNLNGHHFRRQHPIGHFIADFACMEYKLVLEYLIKNYAADEVPKVSVNKASAIELESGLSLKRSQAKAVVEYREKTARSNPSPI